MQKTQALLHGTPAKAKFFSAPAAPDSPAVVVEPRERAAIGAGDGLAQLEQEEEAKHAQQFLRPSQIAPPAASSAEAVVQEAGGAAAVAVERQRLSSFTSKHCGTCDKLLVKLDANPSTSALDAKNRVHVAAIFVLHVFLASISAKEKKVTLLLRNPMKNAVQAELSPLAAGCRFTLAQPLVVALPASAGRAPQTARHAGLAIAVTPEPEPKEMFGVVVTLRYEGVLGKQETRYNVFFSK